MTRLVCPKCGHDGTPETSRPPLGSYGFNYLAEGVVSREVRGYDGTGRLRLSGDVRCEASQATNARIECRSCWRTFPVPEGLPWATAPEDAAGRSGASATLHGPMPGGTGGPELAAETISQGSASILRNTLVDAQSATALRIAKLELSVASLAQAVRDTPSLKAEVAALRDETASLLRAQEQTAQAAVTPGRAVAGVVEQVAQLRETIVRLAAEAKERADALDAAHREAGQARTWLGEVIAELEVGEQAIRQRLDGQADVIRGLHAAAQEQVTRTEELRAAVQRLEEIVNALNPPKPLPEDL